LVSATFIYRYIHGKSTVKSSFNKRFSQTLNKRAQ